MSHALDPVFPEDLFDSESASDFSGWQQDDESGKVIELFAKRSESCGLPSKDARTVGYHVGSKRSVIRSIPFEVDESEWENQEEDYTGTELLKGLAKNAWVDDEGIHGVFAPTYKKKVLHRFSIRLKTSEIKRWKPYISLEDATFSLDDD